MNEEVLTEQLDLYVTQSPKEGQLSCGDSYVILFEREYVIIAMADGLGSGVHAKESSVAVIKTIQEFHHEDVHSLFIRSNEALRAKRGAAVAIAKVYFSNKEIVYASVGNIRFTIISPSGKTTFPLPKVGYLSGKPVIPNVYRFSYESNSLFVMNSDGVKSVSTRELMLFEKSLPALVKYLEKNITRKDDATLLVGKIKQ